MTVENPADSVDHVIARRLRQFQVITGLPVVFGGAVTRGSGRPTLSIEHIRGALGSELEGLHVAPGLGIGGAAMLRERPCCVPDYRSERSITHHYDPQIVHAEKLTSVIALPVRHRDLVAGIVYGAVRTPTAIGDGVISTATDFTASLERELLRVDMASGAAVDTPWNMRLRRALSELEELAGTTDDPDLRRRLRRILADLSSTSSRGHRGPAERPARHAGADRGRAHLAPREIETLRLIALGMTNRQAADAMGLSTETVKAYVRSAMKRLAVGTRTAAVHRARAEGIL